MKFKKMNQKTKLNSVSPEYQRIIYLKELNNLPVILTFLDEGGILFEYKQTDKYSNEIIEEMLEKFLADLIAEEEDNANI